MHSTSVRYLYFFWGQFSTWTTTIYSTWWFLLAWLTWFRSPLAAPDVCERTSNFVNPISQQQMRAQRESKTLVPGVSANKDWGRREIRQGRSGGLAVVTVKKKVTATVAMVLGGSWLLHMLVNGSQLLLLLLSHLTHHKRWVLEQSLERKKNHQVDSGQVNGPKKKSIGTKLSFGCTSGTKLVFCL